LRNRAGSDTELFLHAVRASARFAVAVAARAHRKPEPESGIRNFARDAFVINETIVVGA
jgi:hypothetical protein